MKTITLLLDGVGDRSYEVLGGKTPLQYANTPNLDKLAVTSQCGLMMPHKLGCSLGTDLAHFLLFGYEMKEYPGRAVIDAIGEKHNLDKDTLVLRTSFATVEKKDGYYLKNRFTKNLSDEEAQTLCEALSFDIEGYSIKVLHSYDSHGLIFVKGKNLSSAISDADPFAINQHVMRVEAYETDEESAEKTAELINRYLRKSYEILKAHPVNMKREELGLETANILLSKWAGMPANIECFYNRNGMTGLLLGQSTLLEGLSKTISLDYENYNNLNDGIKKALASDKDYIHLHTKAPDTASHRKDPHKKVQALETIDKELESLLAFEGLLIVTADHSTPCAGEMIHSGESVPFMARGEYIRRDAVKAFDEIACSLGSVTLTASDFMHYIQNATDRGALYHLRAGRKWRNYRVRDINKL